MRYASLLFVLLLSACQRPGDSQPPLIGITQPKSEVLSQRSLRVEGYALDDTGVQSVRTEGKELLTASSRGRKLVRFGFRVEAPQSGKVEVKVDATDKQGQTRTVRLQLTLDARPPQIKLERVEPVSTVVQPARTITKADGTTQDIPAVTETILQISGRVLDDTGVDRVTVEYNNQFNSLSLPKGLDVPFYYEVPARKATIIAVDLAGNRSTLDLSR